MSEHPLQFGFQSQFKFGTLGPSVHFQFRVGAKSGKLVKFGRIVSYRHVTLLQSQKLHLFLPSQISWKVFLKELSLECIPSNHNSLNFHLAAGNSPPIFSFLCQHVASIGHLLNITTTQGSEYSLQALNPLICSIQSESSLELLRPLFTELA
ncbi:hypothetical protein Lalb_Chr12g0206531 [Lupinus albus]|uniref:Uncharacterized protein n=1 Tax=Lupinus albus TaxID=3870 RepID=A0A6A4PN99_LUPAL|nr:hypothetical protein Lalb_Chr12g0206531 [Lupinus albus]